MATGLDAARISRLLESRGASFGLPVSVARVSASTNDDAKRAAAARAPHGASFFADSQTKGRGRSDHAWHSPPGENIYMSVVARPLVAPERLPPLALVVGLAVAEVVDAALATSHVDARAQIKWPNDVWVCGRKLAGVLVEAQIRADSVASVVIGIGLNVGSTSFPPDLATSATSLALLGAKGDALDRSALGASLLVTLGAALATFERDGSIAFALGGPNGLAARDALRGVPVEVGRVAGIGAGIDATGALLVSTPDGEVAVAAGSVRVKPAT